MIRVKFSKHQVPAAQRGQIIQRVLVEGWSVQQTAATFRITERELTRWVAAYRRRGMASLRTTSAADRLPGRWLARLQAGLIRFTGALCGSVNADKTASCVSLKRDGDVPKPGAPPDRRSLWN